MVLRSIIHQGKDIARKVACCLADIYLSSAEQLVWMGLKVWVANAHDLA